MKPSVNISFMLSLLTFEETAKRKEKGGEGGKGEVKDRRRKGRGKEWREKGEGDQGKAGKGREGRTITWIRFLCLSQADCVRPSLYSSEAITVGQECSSVGECSLSTDNALPQSQALTIFSTQVSSA